MKSKNNQNGVLPPLNLHSSLNTPYKPKKSHKMKLYPLSSKTSLSSD